MKTPLYLGVDLGGTNIKAGLVDEQGNIRSEGSCPTLPERGPEEVISDLAALCYKTLHKPGCAPAIVRAAGVGVPGVADMENGVVLWAPNLFWEDVELGPVLEKSLGCPVFLDNDANTAAIAEHLAGAAKGYKNAMVVTLGTGVGAGLIVQGRVLRGAHGLAGELGHMTLVRGGALCNCGNRGCFEMYASARALEDMGVKAAAEDPEGMIARAVCGVKERISAKLVAECAQKGDTKALAIWERYTDALAVGLQNAARVIDPQIIVLGGGVAQAGEFLIQPLKGKIYNLAAGAVTSPVEITCAHFHAQSGIVGAAMLAKSMTQE